MLLTIVSCFSLLNMFCQLGHLVSWLLLQAMEKVYLWPLDICTKLYYFWIKIWIKYVLMDGFIWHGYTHQVLSYQATLTDRTAVMCPLIMQVAKNIPSGGIEPTLSQMLPQIQIGDSCWVLSLQSTATGRVAWRNFSWKPMNAVFGFPPC